MPRLDRRVPPDWRHVERWPLTAAAIPVPPTPMVVGVNWYSAFDSPERDGQGHWWVGRGPLGRVRGGHCVALKARGQTDSAAWWDFYDQGAEGACVGFGCSRLMTLMNRRRYDARWLYHEAQLVDEWPGEAYEGTSVRAGLGVLRDRGHREVLGGVSRAVSRADGIREYRWALSAQDALAVLSYGDKDYVDVLNSWGRSYPHLVRMPAGVLQRLLEEDGEVAVVVDR